MFFSHSAGSCWLMRFLHSFSMLLLSFSHVQELFHCAAGNGSVYLPPYFQTYSGAQINPLLGQSRLILTLALWKTVLPVFHHVCSNSSMQTCAELAALMGQPLSVNIFLLVSDMLSAEPERHLSKSYRPVWQIISFWWILCLIRKWLACSVQIISFWGVYFHSIDKANKQNIEEQERNQTISELSLILATYFGSHCIIFPTDHSV